jgi:hypothetical protein
MLFLPRPFTRPGPNRVRSGLSLLVLLGMFAVTCPETRAYDITFVARPHQTEVDMSFATKTAPAVYTFYGTPQSGWVFYGPQSAILWSFGSDCRYILWP